MPDDNRTSHVRTAELIVIANQLTKVASGVDSIKNDLLPPVATASGEARDGMIRLTSASHDLTRRIKNLESRPPPPHVCEQAEAIREHSGLITAQERQLAGLTRWRWWAMGAVLTIGLFAAGLAGRALLAQGEAGTDRTELRRDVERHESSIDAIAKGRTEDREAIIREVKTIPIQVQQAMPQPDIHNAVDSAELTDRERQLVRGILVRAKKRNGKAHREESL